MNKLTLFISALISLLLFSSSVHAQWIPESKGSVELNTKNFTEGQGSLNFESPSTDKGSELFKPFTSESKIVESYSREFTPMQKPQVIILDIVGEKRGIYSGLVIAVGYKDKIQVSEKPKLIYSAENWVTNAVFRINGATFNADGERTAPPMMIDRVYLAPIGDKTILESGYKFTADNLRIGPDGGPYYHLDSMEEVQAQGLDLGVTSFEIQRVDHSVFISTTIQNIGDVRSEETTYILQVVPGHLDEEGVVPALEPGEKFPVTGELYPLFDGLTFVAQAYVRWDSADVDPTNNVWRKEINWDDVTSVGESNNALPDEFFLDQNYPNPFNPTTTIKFSTLRTEQVALKVYDILGREVATLVNEVKQAGTYIVPFDASSLPSGTYYYSLRTREGTKTQKMAFLK